MVEIRERIQEEAFQAWNTGGRKSIIKAAPRTGKTFIAEKAIPNYLHTIIVLPRNDIIEGWMNTFEKKWKVMCSVEFCTTRSLKKVIYQRSCLLVLDEIQEYSDNQLDELSTMVGDFTVDVMALTGTLTKKKEERIARILGLPISYEYSIEEAVADGILTDYQINVHKIPLDKLRRYITTKKGEVSEKTYFDKIQYAIKKNPKNKAFLDRKLISLLQTSGSKLEATLRFLDSYKEERVLVFCGQTKIADELGIPVYHSKAKEKGILDDFCKNLGINQLATVKMLQAGITIHPIDRGVLNYTSGSPEDCAQKICRFLAYEWNKKATIDILCIDEEFELGRIRTALMYFDESKINYI